MIVAFSLLMIIPSTLLFMNYSSDSKISVISSQVFKLGNELVLVGEHMYSVGHNSWQTIELLIPDDVISILEDGTKESIDFIF